MKRHHLLLGFWGVMLVAVAALYVVRTAHREQAAEVPQAVPVTAETVLVDRQVTPFELTERSGEAFSSSELEGEVWIASFFFTSCPGTCITLNNAIARMQEDFAGQPVRFVSITVHPEYDTPERLREYAERFEADPERWLFLTGDMENIRGVAEGSFLVSAEPASHSDRLMLIGRDGRIRGVFSGTNELEVARLKKKVQELVEETS